MYQKFPASLLILCFAFSRVFAQNPPPASADKVEWDNSVSGPVCGPFAVCSAIRLLGGDTSPKDLITAKYIGACEGTSQSQLITTITDQGYRAYPATGLSCVDLERISLPFIALVRPNAATKTYSHWVTVKQTNVGLLVFDGAKSPYLLTVGEFLGIWSGAGVFVARDIDPAPTVDLLLVRVAVILVGVLVGLLFLFVRRAMADSYKSDLMSLGLSALSIAIISTLIFGDLKNHSIGVVLATNPYDTSIAHVPITDVVSKSTDPAVLIVDARREMDFHSQTIPGSVNIPVYASRPDVATFLKHVRKQTPIYVFCQSSACEFDDVVAKVIKSLGYSNVHACSEGISEWLATQPTTQVEDERVF